MLHNLLRTSARRAPDAPALCAPDGTLTYGELDAFADRVALKFLQLGVRPGDRIAIWLDKSTAAIAAAQAALRIGAVYVPLDEKLPAKRACLLISDCAATVVFTSAELAGELAAQDMTAVPVRTDEFPRNSAMGPPAERLPEISVEIDDPAYILYTSGSTGSPKGVCISHRNALAFIEWARVEIAATSRDNFANHAPLTFDLTVFDIYVAFSVGACVHCIPYDTAYAPRRLADFIDEHQISIWYSVPAALILMMRHGDLLTRRPSSLRVVLFAGEEFPIAPLRQLREHLPSARFLNLYGPTETNVCTYWEVRQIPGDRTLPVPIGKACSGDTVSAVRPDGGPAEEGEIGELVVDGPTVMLGYWGQPPQAGRPYATGDLVRVLSDEEGAFQFVGRRDAMRKVRGHRVELGEIESVLTEHPAIAEAAAVVAGQSVDAIIVAFVVPAGQATVPSLLACKRYCASRLPRYAIVDRLHALLALPRTRNGKLDRDALLASL
jgi:amino acid adenylation domain-containing protein